VFNFLQSFEEMGMVRIDGCRFGLRDDHGDPIKKPWRVATACQELLSGLQDMRCTCTVPHTPCQGKYTKRTEAYTPLLVARIHDCFRQHAKNTISCSYAASTACPAPVVGNLLSRPPPSPAEGNSRAATAMPRYDEEQGVVPVPPKRSLPPPPPPPGAG
jgi:hypothetical protein